MVKRVMILVLIGFTIMRCNHYTEKKESADQIFKRIEHKSYDSFRKWSIFRREGKDYFIFRKVGKDETDSIRLIASKDNHEIWFRLQIPFEGENTQLNSNTNFELAKVMQNFFELNIDKLDYRKIKDIEIIVVSKEEYIYLYVFDKKINNLPQNIFDRYTKINSHWYKFKMNNDNK